MNKYKKPFLIIGLIMMQLASVAQNIDVDILKTINKRETGFKDKYLGFNASSVYPVSIAVPLSIAVAAFIKHDNELKKDALFMGASIIASTLVTTATKHLVNRKRPFAAYDFIVKREDNESWLSFPSGHTSAAFCTATSLALRYHKWYVIAPAGIYAVSVGWARLYQGVHYPSDVLAGALVGAGSAWLGYKAQKWITRKKVPKKKVTL
jgi:membrane-associated phospholipid phosphatase